LKRQSIATYGEVPGTAYTLSEIGWISAKIFDNWFHNHFLCYVPPVWPILLMLDGHSTHYNPRISYRRRGNHFSFASTYYSSNDSPSESLVESEADSVILERNLLTKLL